MLNPNDFFSPTQSIRDGNVHMFSGRVPQLIEGLNAIGMQGAALDIVGQRAVGKTSFAWHLRRIAERGTLKDSPYPDKDEALKSHLLRETFDTLWLQCRDDMYGILGVLAALMRKPTGADTTLGGSDRRSLLFNDTEVDAIERIVELDLKLLKIGSKTKKKAAKHERSMDEAEFVSVNSRGHALFFDALARYKRVNSRNILIFLDEFDVLRDTTGFGHLIKSCNDARFVIIGVAESSGALRRDHKSVGRKLIDIKVPALSPDEVNAMLDKAEAKSKEFGQRLRFNSNFREGLVGMTGGYPELIHRIGFEAVRFLRVDGKSKELQASEQLLLKVEDHLWGSGASDQEVKVIRDAVGESGKRERMLFSLSELDGGWVAIESLKRTLPTAEQGGYYDHIDSLITLELLEKNITGDSVRFQFPTHRMLVRNAKRIGRHLTV